MCVCVCVCVCVCAWYAEGGVWVKGLPQIIKKKLSHCGG